LECTEPPTVVAVRAAQRHARLRQDCRSVELDGIPYDPRPDDGELPAISTKP